jgi:hypothetical protein
MTSPALYSWLMHHSDRIDFLSVSFIDLPVHPPTHHPAHLTAHQPVHYIYTSDPSDSLISPHLTPSRELLNRLAH